MVGDAETGKVLTSLVKSDEACLPSVKDTIKDLGVDNSLARKRRLKTHSARLLRGGKRLQKIKKLPAPARRKYVSMSAAPAALCTWL